LAKNEPILIIFGVQNPEEISYQKIINTPTSPEKCHFTTLWKQLIWCWMSDSRPHTKHINQLFSVPPTYYWERLL